MAIARCERKVKAPSSVISVFAEANTRYSCKMILGPIDQMPARLRHGLTGIGHVAGLLLDFLLPPQCATCRQLTDSHDALCATCWAKLPLIERPYCERLGIPFAFDPGERMIGLAAQQDPPPYGRARAACRFEGIARDLVHAVKYRDRHDVVALMARLMSRAGRELIDDADIVLPVPLHRGRLWRRRYNQATLLASEIGARCAKPVPFDLLLRIKRTRQQVGLSADQRRRNVAGAFSLAGHAASYVDGAQILLIDDVLTTGATVEGCTKTLLRAGCRGVDILTFARVADTISSPI